MKSSNNVYKKKTACNLVLHFLICHLLNEEIIDMTFKGINMNFYASLWHWKWKGPVMFTYLIKIHFSCAGVVLNR